MASKYIFSKRMLIIRTSPSLMTRFMFYGGDRGISTVSESRKYYKIQGCTSPLHKSDGLLCPVSIIQNNNIPLENFKTVFIRCYKSDVQRETIEKQLIKHMDMWELEKAVMSMRSSVLDGTIPHNNVTLNLLQQLANLAEVELLFSLYELIMREKMCSETLFFKCLQEAYYNSGRVDEGIAVLRLLYHKTRKYEKIDAFFTHLAVMIIKHFPHKIDLITCFVEDLHGMNVLEPQAALWKSYILTENFHKASDLLERNEEDMKHFIPQMINDILTGKNNVEYNELIVLNHLYKTNLPVKSRLNVRILEHYLLTLCKNKKYEEVVEILMSDMGSPIKIHEKPILEIIDYLQGFSEDCTDEETQKIQSVIGWYKK